MRHTKGQGRGDTEKDKVKETQRRVRLMRHRKRQG